MTELPGPCSLSIVIPVYRGAQTIGPLVDLLIDTLSKEYLLEIVLVNDCSPDDSETMCLQKYRAYPDIVRFYSLAKNVGEHNAVMAGLNNCSGEWVVIMDDDFQNPVSEVRKLVAFAREHSFDVVYTWYQQRKHSLFRRIGSSLNDQLATILLKKPKNLYLSSFKAIRRPLVNHIITYTAPYPYIDGLILNATNNIGKVKVEHHERATGASGYTLKKLVSLSLTMFTNFSVVPLRIATGIGFMFALLSFAIGVEIIIERLTNPTLPPGYSFTLFFSTLFAGIQLIAIGLVGEYVGRIFVCMNKRPQYFIGKSFGPTEQKIN
jgi:undecaprenyl-phosphate 4-deoxy-4-formamido-L-arabinose transferase